MTQASPQRAAGKATDLLTLDDVRAAAARIEGAVVRTPMQRSQTLSEITGADIWLKFENHQFTAAYKERGALNALLHLSDEQKARGVIAASAGNHSQGLSYHGRRLRVPVTIVMPQTTPSVKVMQTESVGGQVVLHGETFDEAYAHARELEQERGLTFVHPFDDPLVAAGQGTVALEMLAEINVWVDDPRFARQLDERIFQTDLPQCERAKPIEMGWGRKLRSRTLHMMRGWL